MRVKLERQSRETYLCQIGALGCGLLVGVLIARVLGPAGKGAFAWLMLWPALLVVAGRLGLDAAATYYCRVDPASRAALQRMIAPVAGAIGISLSLAFLGLALWSGRGEATVDGRLLAVALATAPVALYTALTGGVLLGCGWVRAFNLLTLLVPALQAAALLLLWWHDPARLTLLVALSCWAGATLLAAATAWLLGRRAAGGGQRAGRDLVRRSLRYGLQVHLGGIAAHLNLRLMHFLVGSLLGAHGLGIYAVAVSGAEVLAYFAIAESLVLFPAASALPSAERWRLIWRRTRRTLGLFCAAGVMAFLAVGPIVQLLFGEAFAGVVPVFRLLLPGMAAHSLNLMLGTGLRAAGKPLAPTRAAWIALAISAPLAPLVLSHWGLLGAAGLFSFAQVSSCLALAVEIRRELRRDDRVTRDPARAPAVPGGIIESGGLPRRGGVHALR